MRNGLLPLALKKDTLIVQEFPDEILIYDSDYHKAYYLNHAIAFVWKHCDGKNKIIEIARLLEKELKISPGYPNVQHALGHLKKCNLLE